tara:strand:- start:2195 stop:3568 length:1374 start_codon:yes stop_codon:yes gene_type:complete
MKRPIENYIFDLLKQHDCVIITGFGGFILNPRPAYINAITHQIFPPSKFIAFNKNLCQNDGLLANFISEKEKISYNEACVEILKFSRKAKLKISRGETIIFDKIGEIFQNDTGKFAFKWDDNYNFNKHSYGLKQFQLSEIKQNQKLNFNTFISSAAVILLLISISIFSLNNNNDNSMSLLNIGPTKSIANYSPRSTPIDNNILSKETPGIYNVKVSQVDFDLYKINGTNYHITTKKCFKLGFSRDVQIKIWKDKKDKIERQICFLNVAETEYNDCYKITQVYNELTSNSQKVVVLTKRGKMKEATLVLEESYIDPYIIANSNPNKTYTNNTEPADTLKVQNIGQRFVDAIQSITESQENQISTDLDTENIQLNDESIKQTVQKKVFIIVGSFSNIANAKALSKQLKKRGFTNANIVGKNKNGLIRVSVDSFFTEEEAHLVLKNIKDRLSSAWVLNEN